MSTLDAELLAEKAAAVERHLARVAQRLPDDPAVFKPATDASDAVVLHLWQAVQLVVDLALAACIRLNLGTPENYGEAFLRLAEAGHIDRELGGRLVQAAGFRNRVVHGYEMLDMLRVHAAAKEGPTYLRLFVSALSTALGEG